MLFTFMDLEPRKKVENALRQSKERFAKSFKLAPIPTLLSRLDGLQTLDANDAFSAETGYVAEEVIGRTLTDIGLWNDVSVGKTFERAVIKQGRVRDLEVRLRTKDDAQLECLLAADTVSIHDQDCVLSVLRSRDERYIVVQPRGHREAGKPPKAIRQQHKDDQSARINRA